ncbi:MAG: response regulator transcription factor [Acidobacteriaceae bacterium]|jgi:two-component system, NarL family, nitrate/nitrite response regulator NarL
MIPYVNNLPSPIRILVADDHPLFRDGLRRLLQSEPGFEVVGEASDGDELLPLVRKAKPDILLLDLSMPRRDGMTVLRELAAAKIPVRTLLLTAAIDQVQIVQALRLGAYGVILKESTTQRLFDSIRCVMAGQYWVGRESVSDLVKALRTAGGPPDGGAGLRARDFGLTPREMEIVTLVVAGYSNPDIAQRCSISEQTVKHHVSNIFDKLGVSNRLELALFAVNHRLTAAAS